MEPTAKSSGEAVEGIEAGSACAPRRLFQSPRRVAILLGLLTLGSLLLAPLRAEAAFDNHDFRWAYDDLATPTDRSGADNASITIQRAGTGARNPIVRLRYLFYVNSGNNQTLTDLKLQYTANNGSNWASYTWTDVGAPGAIGVAFRFRASDVAAVVHGNTVAATITTTHTENAGQYLEDIATGWSVVLTRKFYYEYDYSIEYAGNDLSATTYQFRAVVNGAAVLNTGSAHTTGPLITVQPAPYIGSLTTDKASYPTIGETISVTGNLQNPNDQNYTGTSVEYVIFIDADSDSIPDTSPPETYVTCSSWSGTNCTASSSEPYDAGDLPTRTSTGITVNSGLNADDVWSIINSGFPQNTTYTIQAKWKDSAGNVLDTKTTTLSSIPTLGIALFALALGLFLLLPWRRGHILMRRRAT